MQRPHFFRGGVDLHPWRAWPDAPTEKNRKDTAFPEQAL
ncbi:hypothetical protein ASZ90_001925 [hydrocarbon metagenome]|uniref:Uncharacterized protein n=1 Tax=hydrocarbon metagenome TaxID=938273 RepID=A0A0W8G4Z9_9ZZZZ